MALADLRNLISFRGGGAGPAAVAVAVAVLAWFGVRSLFFGEAAEAPSPAAVAPELAAAPELPPPEPPPSEPEAPVYPKLLVATQPIQSGVSLDAGMVDWREWRDEVDLEMFVLEQAVPLSTILGSVARRAYPVGAPISWDGIIIPGAPGFIGAVLEPGMRAVAVTVDRATASANIIYPGSRVDVILIGDELTSHAIVGDVRVLAVGSTVLSLGRFGHRGGLLDDALGSMPTLAQSEHYTLEVSSADANRIALAMNSGTITLAMRSVAQPAYADYGSSAPVYLSDILTEPAPLPLMGEEDWMPEPRSVRFIRGGEGGIDDQSVSFGPRAEDSLAPSGALAPGAGDGAGALEAAPGGET